LLEGEAEGFRHLGLALAGLKPSSSHVGADVLIDDGGVSGHLIILRCVLSTLYHEPSDQVARPVGCDAARRLDSSAIIDWALRSIRKLR